jgi:hypothetical protein
MESEKDVALVWLDESKRNCVPVYTKEQEM